MVEIPPPAQPTVDAIYAAREREAAERPSYEGYGIAASALGSPCDRQLWMTLRWVSPPETMTGRKLRIFERGDIEEDRVLADLRRAGVEISREQERFSLANGFLRGKVDAVGTGILEAPAAEHVVEIKSAKASDYRAVQKHGLAKHKPEHWHQVHAGMTALGIERGAYVIVNKDTEEIYLERVHYDAEEAARQIARVERIVEADEAPGRIAEEPTRPPCLFCKHKAACFERGPVRRSCRTCLHFRFTRDGNGHCARFDEPRNPQRQQDGAKCPVHLFLPSLVPGEQIDADAETETVTYRMADGSFWVDGPEVVG